MNELLQDLARRDASLVQLLKLAEDEGRHADANRLASKIQGLRIAIDLVHAYAGIV